MEVLEQDTGETIGEVAYTRGLTNHPWQDKLEVHAIVEACRETGILMSPSDESSSDTDKSEEADDEHSSSCHGFSPPSSDPSHFTDIEDDPMYAVLLDTIQRQQQLHESRRQSSTAAPAPHQPIREEDVLHHAPATPPHQPATPEVSPIQFHLRSGRTIKQGAPKKKRGGTQQRR